MNRKRAAKTPAKASKLEGEFAFLGNPFNTANLISWILQVKKKKFLKKKKRIFSDFSSSIHSGKKWATELVCEGNFGLLFVLLFLDTTGIALTPDPGRRPCWLTKSTSCIMMRNTESLTPWSLCAPSAINLSKKRFKFLAGSSRVFERNWREKKKFWGWVYKQKNFFFFLYF